MKRILFFLNCAINEFKINLTINEIIRNYLNFMFCESFKIFLLLLIFLIYIIFLNIQHNNILSI